MHYVCKPPYLVELLSKPYPEKYETPTFALYDGRKGNAIEHVSKIGRASCRERVLVAV